MTLNGAELIVRSFEQEGITRVSGVPGGAVLPLYDALRASRIEHVLARHEQAAGFIAQGEARALGRPAVCIASSGPGAMNLLTAVADAKLDSVPLIAVTAQVPRALIGTDAFQEVPTEALMRPITKRSFFVGDAAQLTHVMPEAFRLARSGRPGPVSIDVPKDVLCESVGDAKGLAPSIPDAPPPPAPDAIARILEQLALSRRPLVLVGGGVISAGASRALRWFVERHQVPVAATLHGLGAFPGDHFLWLGMVGMHGAPYTNHLLEECDLLLALGVRFDDRATGKLEAFCPSATVIHVDVDARELGRLKPVALGVNADARVVLEGLLASSAAPTDAPALRAVWLDRVAELRRGWPLPRAGSSLRDARRLVRALAAATAPETIVVTDVGQHQMYVAQEYPFRLPRTWLSSGGLGTMGFGLPAAIGAALATGRPVLCVTGDGSLLMNIQELATLAERELPVKVVVMNNRQLGLVRQQQDLFYAGRHHGAHFARPTDFVRVARGFGLHATRVGPKDSALLRRALAAPGPSLIDAPIDETQWVLPMVPPGAANRDMIGAGPVGVAAE